MYKQFYHGNTKTMK